MVRYEYINRFGYYCTESSEHNAEYNPFYIKSKYPELIEKFNSSAETGKSIRAVATPKILSHSNRGIESSIATNHRVMASVVYEPFNAYSPSQLYDQSLGDIGGGMSSLNTRQNAFPGMETDPGVRDPESPIGEPYILIVFAIFAIIYTSKNRKSIIQ